MRYPCVGCFTVHRNGIVKLLQKNSTNVGLDPRIGYAGEKLESLACLLPLVLRCFCAAQKPLRVADAMIETYRPNAIIPSSSSRFCPNGSRSAGSDASS